MMEVAFALIGWIEFLAPGLISICVSWGWWMGLAGCRESPPLELLLAHWTFCYCGKGTSKTCCWNGLTRVTKFYFVTQPLFIIFLDYFFLIILLLKEHRCASDNSKSRCVVGCDFPWVSSVMQLYFLEMSTRQIILFVHQIKWRAFVLEFLQMQKNWQRWKKGCARLIWWTLCCVQQAPRKINAIRMQIVQGSQSVAQLAAPKSASILSTQVSCILILDPRS